MSSIMIDTYSEDLWFLTAEEIKEEDRNVYDLGTFFGHIDDAHRIAKSRINILEKLHQKHFTWYTLESLHGIKATRLLK